MVAITTESAAGPGCCSTAPVASGRAIRRPSARSEESALSSTTGVSPTAVTWHAWTAPAPAGPGGGVSGPPGQCRVDRRTLPGGQADQRVRPDRGREDGAAVDTATAGAATERGGRADQPGVDGFDRCAAADPEPAVRPIGDRHRPATDCRHRRRPGWTPWRRRSPSRCPAVGVRAWSHRSPPPFRHPDRSSPAARRSAPRSTAAESSSAIPVLIRPTSSLLSLTTHTDRSSGAGGTSANPGCRQATTSVASTAAAQVRASRGRARDRRARSAFPTTD